MVERAKAMSLEGLKNARFILAMKDRWNMKDHEWDNVLWNEIIYREKRG